VAALRALAAETGAPQRPPAWGQRRQYRAALPGQAGQTCHAAGLPADSGADQAE